MFISIGVKEKLFVKGGLNQVTKFEEVKQIN